MRAQISFEFIIIFVVAMIIFLAVFSAYSNKTEQTSAKQTQLHAQTIASQVVSDIDSIYVAGPNSRRFLSLPSSLKDNTDYSLNIYADEHIVEVGWNDGGVDKRYTKSFSAPIIMNWTNITKFFWIKNRNGYVTLAEGPIDGDKSGETATVAKWPEGDDYEGSKCDKDDICIILYNVQDYDIVMESFTLWWDDPNQGLKHFSVRTEANGWNQQTKIYEPPGSEPRTVVGTFTGDLDTLTIPANSHILIDEIKTEYSVTIPTSFILVLKFTDGTTSTIPFTIDQEI